MRYYHYISDAKAEMLFPQVPPPILQGLSAEIGFDFGLLKGKLAGAPPSLTSRVARVQAVERFLERDGQIAESIQEAAWIRGRARLRSGYLPSCKGLVLFAGVVSRTTLILAGSEAHLISGSSSPGQDRGWSFLPRILAGLRDYVEENLDLADVEELESFGIDRDLFLETEAGILKYKALHEVPFMLPEPEFDVSFLARCFVVHASQDGRLAIASPLYVAE